MASKYTVKQMSDLAHISDSSVRKWGADQLRAHLSDGANPGRGVERSYTDHDAAVFYTAGQLRAQRVPWPQVVEAIDTDGIMPPKPATDSPQTASESQEKGLVLASEWERMTKPFKDHIDTLKGQLEQERVDRLAERDARVKAEQELDRLKSRGWWSRLFNR